MAVKEDVDICLNIIRGTVNSNKKTSQIIKDIRTKRLKKNTSEKIRKSFQKFQSTEPSKSLVVGAKKRIKQKTLANIVANNLKKVKRLNPVPQATILKKSNKSTQKSLNEKLAKVVQDAESTKEKRVSFLQSQNASTSNNLVSFTKRTKENTVKPVLVKKRKIDTGEPKKSLTSIFETSTSTETTFLNNNIGSNKSKTKLSNIKPKIEILARRPKTADITLFERDGPSTNWKTAKDRIKKKEGNIRPHSHPTGKVSSLFGNNPTVPSIGQRFVKPVNEQVFSAEKFSELGIHAFSVSNMEQNMKITTMTTVQKKAIPIILSGSDVLIRSQTGSGKTLSYALPIIENLQSIRPKLPRNSGIKGLIIVPTRELALQTYECFLKLIKPFTWIVPGYLVGGEKRKAEKARLRKGCTVLIATPGRLLDHIKHTQALKLDNVQYFILDEADRMLDMGYEKDISEIIAALEGASGSNNSGYDALQMLRKSIQPNNDNKIEYQNESKIESNEEDHSDEEKNVVTKRQYHSDDEDSNDESELKTSESVPILNFQREKTEQENSSDNTKSQKRQTILLSATLTHAVEKLAGLTMHNPVFVDAAKENIEAAGGSMSEINEDLVVPQSVIQSYIVTPPKLRMVTLSAFIAGKCQSHGDHKILIFMATQDMVDYYTEILSSALNKPVDDEDEDSDPLVDAEFFKLHGNMSQKERTEVFKTFRQANSGVLLCTDVAARGLDLPKVDAVVQYTGPTSTRDYVHRIGRTARAGSAGTATIFLTPSEIEFVRALEARRIRIKQDDMDDVLAKLLGPLSRHNSVQAAAIALQNDLENLVLENKKFYAMACKAYTSWVRFYSSYPREMREFFNRKDLHLGHYAKSFALRDPPQKIGGAGKSIREKEEAQQPRPKHQNRLSNQRGEGAVRNRGDSEGGPSKRQQDRRSGMLKHVRMLNTSEYGSGLEPIKKFKK